MQSFSDINKAKIKDANLHELIIGIGDHGKDNFPVEKLDAHKRNVPHIAISIFVFRGDKLLIQQRAATKYHSGGLWTNSVCSHPRWQESEADCANRRLEEELGWTVPLQKLGQIGYSAKVGWLYENELVHCYFGQFTDTCNTDQFNREEVAAVRWATINELIAEIGEAPERFSAWFRIYLSEHLDTINKAVNHKQNKDNTRYQ